VEPYRTLKVKVPVDMLANIERVAERMNEQDHKLMVTPSEVLLVLAEKGLDQLAAESAARKEARRHGK
jgi:hypothetical protein